MVRDIRTVEKALGHVSYAQTEKEKESAVFRRSLFVVKDVKQGQLFTDDNVRSIRPGYGLHTRYLPQVTGRKANRDIAAGTPLAWDLLQ
jgi:sialic acid synthase SpsE